MNRFKLLTFEDRMELSRLNPDADLSNLEYVGDVIDSGLSYGSLFYDFEQGVNGPPGPPAPPAPPETDVPDDGLNGPEGPPAMPPAE
jgi:hypothetical protein